MEAETEQEVVIQAEEIRDLRQLSHLSRFLHRTNHLDLCGIHLYLRSLHLQHHLSDSRLPLQSINLPQQLSSLLTLLLPQPFSPVQLSPLLPMALQVNHPHSRIPPFPQPLKLRPSGFPLDTNLSISEQLPLLQVLLLSRLVLPLHITSPEWLEVVRPQTPPSLLLPPPLLPRSFNLP